MTICGLSRTSTVCVLTIGFVSVFYAMDHLNRDDCCSNYKDTLKDLQCQLAALQEEIDRQGELNSSPSRTISCNEILTEMGIKQQRIDELETQIRILQSELDRDVFFTWQRAIEYPAGTNCSIHMDYEEGHECKKIRTQHLSELGEVERKTQRIKKLEWHHIEMQLAEIQLKKFYQFKKCAQQESSGRGNMTRFGFKSGKR